MSLNSLGASNGHPSSRMTHSLSTPSGVDGSTSASHHSRGGGKKLAVRVQMLDDSMTMFQVQVGNRKNKKNHAHAFLHSHRKCSEKIRQLEVNDFIDSIFFSC